MNSGHRGGGAKYTTPSPLVIIFVGPKTLKLLGREIGVEVTIMVDLPFQLWKIEDTHIGRLKFRCFTRDRRSC